jgi:hypothetical protein
MVSKLSSLLLVANVAMVRGVVVVALVSRAPG